MKCQKCGYENKENATHCDLCQEVLIKTSGDTVNDLPMSEQQKKLLLKAKALIYEARAKIFWGYSVSKVKTWLASQGVPPQQIDEFVTLCLAEYRREKRQEGIRNLGVGSTFLIISILVIILCVKKQLGRIGGYPVALGMYGIWCIIKGLDPFVDDFVRFIKKWRR